MSSSSSKGYTLIELLIVITISIIVFSVGYAGYREFSRRQDLAGVVKSVFSDLRLLQQLSLSGQKPSGSTCDVLNGYSLVLTSNTSYTTYANCTNSGNPATVAIKSVAFPSNVTLSATTNTTLFKVLGQGTNLSATNTFTFSNTVTGSARTITIGVGGDIQ